jgi:spermidine synthase
MRVSFTLRAALALIGFTAILAQVVLMRELMVVFYGNEISLGIVLANWLLWTAFGSGVLGRLAGRTQNPRALLAGLQAFVAVAFPSTLLAVRASKNAFHVTAGEILGPAPMFLISLVVLSVFCSVSGMLFAAGSAAFARDRNASTGEASSSVYLLEAAGSGVGGLLASLVFIRYLTAFEIASIVSLLNFVAATVLVWQPSRLRRAVIGFLFAAFALLVFPFVNDQLERASLAWLWRDFQIVKTRNSVYGNLAVVRTEGAHSLFQNGLVMFTVPDPAAAEEAVHFALLQHPAPKDLLLIGGGLNGSLRQALQHPTLKRADYVELDPAIFELARAYFPSQWAPVRSDPRVHAHATDGRLFLKTTPQTFDVIILNLPDPETAQLNRFYTLEFFREAAARLRPDGVFSLQVRASENYISPELAEFLRCVRKTLADVFPAVTFMPGETFHLFAAKHDGILATGPQELLERLQSRHLQTSYVREYYIPFRMLPDRMRDTDAQTRWRADTPVNRDFTPVAYYFGVALWSGRFHRDFRRAFHSLAGIRFDWIVGSVGLVLLGLVGMLGGLAGRERRHRLSAGICVAATGFTLMGLEVLILLGFQALFGYVYYQLAILIAAFMVGMAAGSRWALRAHHRTAHLATRRGDSIALAWLQAIIAISPLLLYALLVWFTKVRSTVGLFAVSQLLFPLLALLSGLLGGYEFPVASRVFFSDAGKATHRAGTLYALDLLGACLGAVVLSVYLVPVFGFFKTALLIAVVNAAPVGLAFLSSFRQRPRPA